MTISIMCPNIKKSKTSIVDLTALIHKAAGLTVHGRSTGLPGIIPKISKETAVQNALQTPLLYGGRPYGGFVNRAVSAAFRTIKIL